jgi:Tol biopolymer transport system component
VAATETPTAPQTSELLFVYAPQSTLARLPNEFAQRPQPEQPVPAEGFSNVGSTPVIPQGCEAMGAHAAPRGPWVAMELACVGGEASVVQIFNAHNGEVKPIGQDFSSQVVFLGWSPNGQHIILLKDALSDAGAVLVNVANGDVTPLSVPGDTYNVALSNDGKWMVYSLTQGLGFGSETWLANIDGSQPQLLSRDPQHIVAYARFSPNGQHIAFIKMPDSNIPFTVGELWVTNADGTNATLLGAADAGHGYAPAWSPDSTRIAYVFRENAENILADQVADRLASNLHMADLQTGSTQAVTRFTETLVEAPVWSPDGLQVAFAARPNGGVSDVWLLTPNNAENGLLQATQNADVRYPVFTSDR